MFISIAILFIICGILLLLKTKKMPKEQGLHIITGVGAIVLIILLHTFWKNSFTVTLITSGLSKQPLPQSQLNK